MRMNITNQLNLVLYRHIFQGLQLKEKQTVQNLVENGPIKF